MFYMHSNQIKLSPFSGISFLNTFSGAHTLLCVALQRSLSVPRIYYWSKNLFCSIYFHKYVTRDAEKRKTHVVHLRNSSP